MPSTTFTSDDFTLVRRNRLVMALASLPLLSLVAVIAVSTAVDAEWLRYLTLHLQSNRPVRGFIETVMILGIVLVPLLSLLLPIVAFFEEWRAVREPVRVKADGAGLTLGARLVVRSTIRSGLVQPGHVDIFFIYRRGEEERYLGLIEERIREAMDDYGRGDTAADAALLRRGDRAAGAWLSALRSIGAGANTSLRTAPVSRERLLRVAEDPASPVVERVAAAVALGDDEDGESRSRLRSLAEATAAPDLRRAIEEAGHSRDDAELAEALAQVEEESRRAARR